MARRMAGTDSAFTIGLRVGTEIGGQIAKTADVLKDRADKKKAEQVNAEFQNALKSVKAPWDEVQERARAKAKEYSDKGIDMPQDEAVQLQQEIRTARMDFLTNQMDLAMTYQGANAGNKYVEKMFQPIIGNTLTQLQAVSSRAQLEMAEQQQAHLREREAVEDARWEFGAEQSLDREAATESRFRRAERGKTERARLAAGSSGRTPELGVNDILAVTEEMKAAGAGQPPEFWENIVREEGLEPNPYTIANAKGQWIYDQTISRLQANGHSPEQLASIPHPINYAVPEDPDEKYIADLQEDVEAWKATGDPKYRVRIEATNELIAKAQEKRDKKQALANQPAELRRANENWNETSARGVEGWWARMQELGSGANDPGEYGVGPMRGPKRGGASEESGPASKQPYRGQAQEFNRGTGMWEDRPSGPIDEAAAEAIPDPDEMPTWQGKPVRLAPKGSWNRGSNLVTDDGPVPPEVESEMLQDYHNRGQVAPWMK